MKEQLESIRLKAITALEDAETPAALEELRVKLLGKKGELTAVLKQMGKLSAEERPVMGQMANSVRSAIEEKLEERKATIHAAALEAKLSAEAIDVTIPGESYCVGHQHPMNQVLQQIKDTFVGMGYQVVEGPEVELADYNFTRLNIEEGHPSRDRSDTFYFTDDDSVLLRTQTSPMQIRVMENTKPPICILAPGRVFRKDEADATHSPMFHQIEGLVVAENITMGDLKGALIGIMRKIYGHDAQMRFRPHHFPFTEPSCEMDMQCHKCHGVGEIDGQVCSTCHGEGWIELLGAGMVHPTVLENCGIDPEKYSGFAFGLRTTSLHRPYEETILYKLHVRGFTKDGSSRVKNKGTFRGVIEKIPYLKELGINAVELMPSYEFFEWTSLTEPAYVYPAPAEEKRVNYWGYGTKALYFAPKASYAASADAVAEFAEMVDALHENGIECLMEFCFAPGTPSGFALQVLHHWQLRYQIDGFHLVGDASLAEEASKDALLRKTKLIFLGFDGARIYQGKRPWFRNLGEHNQGYQYHIRRFLKGDEGSLSDFTYYLRRSPETHGVINYLADHDGFTLYDSVSYEQKHNLDNGEDNMDGSNENLTWNCGAEGVTRKPAVRALRLRQLKNAVLMLMTSQGTPLIYGGDEFGNSQKGNNNAWCQDNKTGWIDWKAAARNPEFAAFVKAAIAFRKAHPALHGEREPRLIDYKSYGCPDMSFHSQRAWFSQMENTCRFIGVMYCGSYFQDKDGNKDDDLYIAYNMHWNPHELALPSLPEQKVWYLTADTNTPEVFLTEENQKKVSAKTVIVPPRSIIILTGKQEKRQNDESMAAL